VKRGTDQFRLACFHKLKNQHEAKRLQPDSRLPLVIVRTIQHRVVQINFHFTATRGLEAKREGRFAKANNYHFPPVPQAGGPLLFLRRKFLQF
jgi:hypothetical protein